jgi:hypothetical protein
LKKVTVVFMTVFLASNVSLAADMQQEDASIGLSVPQIIELVGIDMEEVVVPGPEDYARDLMNCRVINHVDQGGAAARANVMGPSYERCCDEIVGKGFAERTDALSMTIFTNAQDGAALYVHGIQPPGPQGILRLEDTYVSVCTEKTYILQNDLEGAHADACSIVAVEKGTTSNRNTDRVEDNPRNDMGGPEVVTRPGGGVIEQGQITDEPTKKAASTWLRVHNQAQHLFEVKMATKAPRLIVINLGIGNLARYTEGEYTNTLTFTLMPIVG